MLYESKGQHKKNKKVAIVMIEGGIGDTLLATPLIRGLRKKHPPEEWYLVLVAMYHEIFGYVDPQFNDGDHLISTNPNIDVLFSMRMNSNLYVNWARNANIIYRQNPYIGSPQRFGPLHMAEIWCKIHEVEMDELKLDYHITEQEEEQAKSLYSMIDNPAVIIHPFGAHNPINKSKKTTNKDWEDVRWYQIVHWLINKGYDVIQVGAEGEPTFDGVFSLIGHVDIRETIAILKYADFFICIDSFILHAAKALEKIGVVLWGASNPYRLGYVENYNVFKLHSCPEIFCGRPETTLMDGQVIPPTHFLPWNCEGRNCMKAINVADIIKGVGYIEKLLSLDPTTYIREME